MKMMKCANCGANELREVRGFLVCEYCDSRFAIQASDVPQQAMGMSINSDVERLLRKCRTDRKNARKYANLILDIDPGNAEARKYL